MEKDFIKIMSETSDEELIEIVTTLRNEYNPAAIIAADFEIKKRGIDPTAEKAKEAIEKAQATIDTAKQKFDSVKDGEDENAKIDPFIAFKQAQQKKANIEGNDDLSQKLGNDIGELIKKKQKIPQKELERLENPSEIFDIIETETSQSQSNNRDTDDNFAFYLNGIGITTYIIGIVGAIYLFDFFSRNILTGKFNEELVLSAAIKSACLLFYHIMFGLICQGLSRILKQKNSQP